MADTRARLYLITPRVDRPDLVVSRLAAALEASGDVACVLLRLATLSDRDAKSLVEAVAAVVQTAGAALLVEDARLATRGGADGVHAAGPDQAFADAIDSVKPDGIVGGGGDITRDDAMRLGEAGADYVLFDAGPDHPEATLERAAWWAEIFNVPCVAVAHSAADIERLAASGAEFVGLAETLWDDPPGLAAVVAEAVAALDRASMTTRAGAPA